MGYIMMLPSREDQPPGRSGGGGAAGQREPWAAEGRAGRAAAAVCGRCGGAGVVPHFCGAGRRQQRCATGECPFSLFGCRVKPFFGCRGKR